MAYKHIYPASETPEYRQREEERRLEFLKEKEKSKERRKVRQSQTNRKCGLGGLKTRWGSEFKTRGGKPVAKIGTGVASQLRLTEKQLLERLLGEMKEGLVNLKGNESFEARKKQINLWKDTLSLCKMLKDYSSVQGSEELNKKDAESEDEENKKLVADIQEELRKREQVIKEG